jgi:malonyl-CoA decarboxylase
LHHVLASWFNRGFLQLRQISWRTPATVLEKLIRYEAVHAIRDWSDLKNRLEGARRCFGFFHPSMPDEPLIFIEVALTNEMADDVAPLLARADDGEDGPAAPRAAIFYSISNCQPGLRNIQFGDFLIKQVVAELRAEIPSLRMFATLSPIPGFRSWLDQAARAGVLVSPALATALAEEGWSEDPGRAETLRGPLTALCVRYLTGVGPDGRQGRVTDPVARFHLSNGARLERINWRADLSPKGIKQSWGLMMNYRYHPSLIDAHQEAFAFEGRVQQSGGVAVLLNAPVRLPKAAGVRPRVASDR